MADTQPIIARDDLKAAVSSGLLTELQAANLISLSDSRRGARENLALGDEPFELFKGFNEIFIVVGLIILATGWYTAAGIAYVSEINNLRIHWGTVAVISAVTLWVLSEYFVRKRRMVAPAIALSIMFASNAVMGFVSVFAEPFMIAQENVESVPMPLVAATALLGVYWWRFRVPFALAMIALGLFATAIILAASRGGEISTPADLFLLSADGPFAWITLGLGLCVFAGAMIFDMSDPHRVTRRAANGFWLHVVAAPMLINTVAMTLYDSALNFLLIGVLALFALIAVIIDRRSFLITAAGYSVGLSVVVTDGQAFAVIILILGAALLLLGAKWEKIRASILRGFARVLPLDRLPPSHTEGTT